MSAIDPRTSDPGVPASLTSELVEVLGLLDRAPAGMAEATLSLLPYGSRAKLLSHGFIETMNGGEEDAVEIRITDAGWHVIRECARKARIRRQDSNEKHRMSLDQFVSAL